MKNKFFFPFNSKVIAKLVFIFLLIALFIYVVIIVFREKNIGLGIVGIIWTAFFLIIPYDILRISVVFHKHSIKLPRVMKTGWIKQKKTQIMYSDIRKVSILTKKEQGEHSLKDFGAIVDTIVIECRGRETYLLRADIFSKSQIERIFAEFDQRVFKLQQ